MKTRTTICLPGGDRDLTCFCWNCSFSLEKQHVSTIQETTNVKFWDRVREPTLLQSIHVPIMWNTGELCRYTTLFIWSSREIHTFWINTFVWKLFNTLAFRVLNSVLNYIPETRLSWDIYLMKISLAWLWKTGECHWMYRLFWVKFNFIAFKYICNESQAISVCLRMPPWVNKNALQFLRNSVLLVFQKKLWWNTKFSLEFPDS